MPTAGELVGAVELGVVEVNTTAAGCPRPLVCPVELLLLLLLLFTGIEFPFWSAASPDWFLETMKWDTVVICWPGCGGSWAICNEVVFFIWW